NRQPFAAVSRHVNVQVQRLGAANLYGSTYATGLAGNDPDQRTIVAVVLGDLLRGNILIAGFTHFFRGRKVHPELEAVHGAVFLLRDFRVYQAAPRVQPLHTAGGEQTLVAATVAVAHATGDHVGNGLEAA